jgi:hypothetical protein
MVNVQHDQDKGDKTNGQAEDVDERSDLVAPEDTERDDQKTA